MNDDEIKAAKLIGKWHQQFHWKAGETNQLKLKPEQREIHEFIYNWRPTLSPIAAGIRAAYK